MSQTHGRYSGPRDKGQRQSSQPSKATFHRQNKPYIKAPPARDPAQTASILKTRSFKLLVDAVGAENIALGLDSNLARVSELLNGERFTPETAFHIETTLGLVDGFFDQLNPVLTPETITRLKSPLDFIHANTEPEVVYEQVVKPAPVTQANQHSTLTDQLRRKQEMPKKTNRASPRTVAKSNATETKPSATTRERSASKKVKAPSKTGTQQPLPLNDVADLEKIRRANLHVLASRKGSKVRLAVVMEISESNMANRFYGQKRMDDTEANRFTERLGLPTGWLDVPHSVTDVPESVSTLLAPPSRHASAEQELSPSNEQTARTVKKPAGAKENKTSVRPTLPPDTDSTDAPTDAVVETNVVTEQLDQAAPTAVKPAIAQPDDNDISFSAAFQQRSPGFVTQVISEPQRPTSATSLVNLEGIEPIAVALLKTLAGKARVGRLDEMKALQLLQQAVLL